MDEYNELFSLVRDTDLLNNEEKIKLKLYLVNTKDKFNKYKSTLDKIKEYIKDNQQIEQYREDSTHEGEDYYVLYNSDVLLELLEEVE